MAIDPNDPATWEPITVTVPWIDDPGFTPKPILPKRPSVGPASGNPPAAILPKPIAGNVIQASPVSWGRILVAALVIGLAIWLIEQNVSDKHAMLLSVVLLLGAAYSWRNFATELQAITQGKV